MRDGWRQLRIRELVESHDERLGGRSEPTILTLTERQGFVRQADRYKRRIAAEDTSSYKVIRKDDIAYNPYLLWKGAIAQSQYSEISITSPIYEVFRPRPEHDPRFVGLLLSWTPAIGLYDSISVGSIERRRRAVPAQFLELSLLVPSLAEQRRIVDVVTSVDKAASAAAALREAASLALDALREELLSDVTGVQRRLSELLVDIDGGFSPLTEGRAPLPGERAVLKLSAIRPAEFDPTEAKAVSPDVVLPRRALVAEGDVLMTRSNTPNTVGTVCRVDSVPPDLYLSDLILRLHPGPDVDGGYLSEALNARAARAQIAGLARGTSGSMHKLSRATILQVEIPLPESRDRQADVITTLRAARDLVRAASNLAHRLAGLRMLVVSDLLSGNRNVPKSYDRLLDGAA